MDLEALMEVGHCAVYSGEHSSCVIGRMATKRRS